MLNSRIKILLQGAAFWYLAEGMLGPLFAVFAERIGGDVLNISWAWATFLIVSGVIIVATGKISDRFISKEKLVVAGFAITAVFTFGYLLVSSPFELFIVEAGLGVGFALALPTWDALYARYESRKQDGYEWGLADGLAQLVPGLAMLIGGLIVNYFSFTALFIVMGTIHVIATIRQAAILRK